MVAASSRRWPARCHNHPAGPAVKKRRGGRD